MKLEAILLKPNLARSCEVAAFFLTALIAGLA